MKLKEKLAGLNRSVLKLVQQESKENEELQNFMKEKIGSFDEKQIRRYSRHIILPEVGGKGQKAINNARVLCVGAGGLGSPAAFYLAAAGVGTIGIIDMDKVDISNLQRQILHSTKDIDKLKVESARETIENLNPDVKVIPYSEKLTVKNVREIIKNFDIVIDGCDNFGTRYLVNDACYFDKKPNVYGSVFRFEGRATLFVPDKGPCYRCLHPYPPPAGFVPSCQEAGILGVLPGTIGLIQATETLKYILGIGKSLVGRLLLYDALELSFKEVKLPKDPNCPLCGKEPKITKLLSYEDYEHICGIVG